MKYLKIVFYLLSMYLTIGCTDKDLEVIPVEDVWSKYSGRIDSIKNVISDAENGWEFNVINLSSREKYIGYLGFEGEKSSFAVDYNLDFAKMNQTDFSISVRKSNPSLSFGNSSAYSDFAVQAADIDTTYTYKYSKNDTLFFSGDIFANELKLFPATSQRKVFYNNDGLEKFVQTKQFLQNSPRFFFNVTYGNSNFFFYKNEVGNNVVFHSLQGEQVTFQKSNFELTLDKLKLTAPITLGGQRIEQFTNPHLENGELIFDEGKIVNAVVPSFYVSDVNNFLRLNPNDENGFGNWLSWYGWSKRNQVDILGLKDWRNDFQILFQYRSGGSQPYNRLGMAYFPGWYWWGGDYAINSSVSNGILISTQYGGFSAATNQTIINMQTASRNYMTEAHGYYVIGTIDNQIVLVDAGTGEKWIYFK